MANDILVKIGADITDFSRKMAESQRQLKTFSTANQQTFDSFKKVGKVATVAGIALATGIGFAVKESVDFESAFAGVRKTVDASESEFNALSDGIRKMATEMPATADEIAGVAEMAGQLGIKKEDILGFTRTMVDLGVATNMSSEEAATSLARLANITGMPMKEIGNLGSTVVDLGNNLATTESEIVEMGLRLAGAGSQAGMTEAEILSFSGALSSVGIRAEAGGSAFSKVITNMQLAAERGGDDLKAFADVAGMSSSEFKDAFEKDAAGALLTFIEGLSTAEERGMSAVGVLDEMGISEVRMRDALLRAAGASDTFSEALEIGANAWEENTALTKEAEERYKTTASKLKTLGNNIKEAAMVLGDLFLPHVNKVIDVIQGLVQKFTGLDDKVKTIIAIVAAATAGFLLLVGPLLMLIGFIPAIIAGFTALTTVLGAVSLPIAAIVAGIAALVAALIYAWNTSEQFREIVTTAFNYVREIVMQVIEEVVAFVMEVWGGLVEFWQEHGEMILEASRNVWETIWSVISVVMEGIWEVIKVAFDLIVEVVTIAWDLISGIFEGAIEVIMGIVQTFAALFTGNWDEMWAGIMRIIDGAWQIIVSILEAAIGLALTVLVHGLELIWTAIKTVFTSVWQFIQTIFGLVVDYIQFAWDNAARIVSEKAAEILKWVVLKFNEVKTTVTTVLTAVAGIIRDKFQEGLTNVITKVTSMYTTVQDKFNEIKTAVTDKMTQVKDQISDKFQEGVNIVRSTLAEMWLTVVEKFTSIYTAVLDKMEQVKQTITDLWDQAVQFLKDIDLFQIGADIIDGLKEGIKSKAKDVAGAAKEVAKNAMDGVKGFLKIKSPSRVMMAIGRFTGEGLADGIADMTGNVAKAAEGLAGAAVVNPEQVSMNYATPSGIRSSLSSAVNGTVDVNSREDMIAGAIDGLRRDMTNLRVEMEGEAVGRLVTSHVNEKNALDSTVRRYF